MRFWWLVAYLSVSCAATVQEASDADLEQILSRGIPTLLSIYASWCSHCKKFEPIFRELAESYSPEIDSKVQFVRINGDSNRKAAKRFNVEYFPTTRWVAVDGSDDEIQERSLEGLQNLISERTGAQKGVAPVEQSYVAELDQDSFEREIQNKSGLVAFTTTWCGYCKQLKPEWEALAKVYARDEDIIIANVDCTDGDANELMSKYNVRGYPTLISLSNGESKDYIGGRSLSSFVDFLTTAGASHRLTTGELGPGAGVEPSLATLAIEVVGKGEESEEFKDFVAELATLSSKFEEKYHRIAKKASVDPSYPTKELARLSKLIAGQITADKKDDFTIRSNLLRQFITPKDEDEAKDEL